MAGVMDEGQQQAGYECEDDSADQDTIKNIVFVDLESAVVRCLHLLSPDFGSVGTAAGKNGTRGQGEDEKVYKDRTGADVCDIHGNHSGKTDFGAS